MANIKIIPPKVVQPKTLRVAAYCRVSTDSEEQAISYASQIRNYTAMISQHENWELVDIYADQAATGTQTEKRDDFNRMIADCRKGKIDRILVKSVSRFARNTKDCLTALRELMQLGVSVQFEKENIDTGTLTSELMVSVFGSLAQQESVSISQNAHMSCRRRMERGEFITSKRPFGYRTVGCGHLEIIPEEADVVRWIFDAYLSGNSTAWIANELSRRKIPIRQGVDKWNANEIGYLLSNEKYIGDALCQKTFKTGFPFVQKRNHGEVDQFYVEETHPAIIDRETFEKVQALRQKKKKVKPEVSEIYPLASKMFCGNCGTALYRRAGPGRTPSWSCKTHLRQASCCPVGTIPEEELYAAFVRMYNKLRLHETVILKPALHQLKTLETALHRKNPAMLEINQAIAQATEQSYKVAQLQRKGLLDADACSVKLSLLNAQLTRLRAERRRLLQNDDIDELLETLRQTSETVCQGPKLLTSFDKTLFEKLIKYITVESNTCIHFQLYGGIRLTEHLWEDNK